MAKTVLYGKLGPGTRIDTPIVSDVDALLDWSAGKRADMYFDLVRQLPKGWHPHFFGLFRGRPDAPFRVCGYLSDEEQELCARDPGRLAEVLARGILRGERYDACAGS